MKKHWILFHYSKNVKIAVLCLYGEFGIAMIPVCVLLRFNIWTLLIRYCKNTNEKTGFRSWNWANLYFDCLVFNQKYRCANMTWFFFDILSSYEKGWEPHLDHTLDMKFIFSSIRFYFFNRWLLLHQTLWIPFKNHLKISIIEST